MTKPKTVEEFFLIHSKWKTELSKLRELTNKTEFEETLKWGTPTYTINGKNVVSIGAFKNYVGLWFFNGNFLKDQENKLINAQEGKTKGMRQWRFSSINEIDVELVVEYLNESIQNQKEGKQLKIVRNKKPLIIVDELQTALNENKKLKLLFDGFSISKQREFSDHILSAKREATKLKRIEKIIPLIIKGEGLHDKYKNC